MNICSLLHCCLRNNEDVLVCSKQRKLIWGTEGIVMTVEVSVSGTGSSW